MNWGLLVIKNYKFKIKNFYTSALGYSQSPNFQRAAGL